MTEKFASRPPHADALGKASEEGEIETSEEYNLFFDDIDFSLNELLGDSLKLTEYTVDDLTLIVPPATTPKIPAASNEGGIVFVTDEGGAIAKIPAWSDGTNWRRFSDGAIIS
jgi:hypothetical protein